MSRSQAITIKILRAGDKIDPSLRVVRKLLQVGSNPREYLCFLLPHAAAAAYRIDEVEKLCELLRSNSAMPMVDRQVLADDITRMLAGESFDKVFGINRRVGPRKLDRDITIARHFWLLRRKGVMSDAALNQVAEEWQETVSTVKRLRTHLREDSRQHIDRLLEQPGNAGLKKIIDSELQIIAEQRISVMTNKKDKANPAVNSRAKKTAR